MYAVFPRSSQVDSPLISPLLHPFGYLTPLALPFLVPRKPNLFSCHGKELGFFRKQILF